MPSDSAPEALRLGDAMKTWTNPKLATDVFVAETAFDRDQLDRFQEDWLDHIRRCRQGLPVEPDEALDTDLRKLRQAWEGLHTDFTTGVAYGEIALWGRLAKPLARREKERLSYQRAKHFIYDVAANAVVDGDRRFHDIFATRGRATAAWEDWILQTRRKMGSVSLETALREWTNPELVSPICHSEREHTTIELAGLTSRPVLSNLDDLAKPSTLRKKRDPSKGLAYLSAWDALERDFRERLMIDEFHLLGVRSKPNRETQAEVLPGVWAADFLFDFRNGTLAFDDMRYVAVSVIYGAAMSASDAADPSLVARAIAIPVPAADRDAHRGGRPTTRLLVEEALRRHWQAIFPHGAPQRPTSWSDLARRLIRRVRGEAGGPPRDFPGFDTVRKHARKDYGRLLVEIEEIAPIDQ